MTNEINTEITKRIAQTEDEDLRGFLEEIIAYEREVLSQQQPHYKEHYRRLANDCMPEDEGDDA